MTEHPVDSLLGRVVVGLLEAAAAAWAEGSEPMARVHAEAAWRIVGDGSFVDRPAQPLDPRRLPTPSGRASSGFGDRRGFLDRREPGSAVPLGPARETGDNQQGVV